MTTKANGTEKATLNNHLGLKATDIKDLTMSLNKLLSDYHIFYQNVRGFHWNVMGSDFFDLHVRFEELYNQLYENIDELAERILTLGYRPLHAYTDFLKNTNHKEITNVKDGKECVANVIDGLGMLIVVHREIVKKADETDDIATADMLTKFVGDLEKRLWMFTMFNK
jgi:starvation-inducible DNA-binding protein